MKKIFSLVLLIMLTLVIAGCNNSNGNTDPDPDPNPDPDNGSTINLQGQEFIIIANTPITADPRSDRYEGLNQEIKIQLIEEVEAKYNIKVVYKPFPSNATWGGARERWVVNNVVTGSPAGHVYEITTTSIPTLASAGAILDLTDYMDLYGDENFPESKKQFGKFLEGHYVYDDRLPMNTGGIYYNMDLLVELGYQKDLPTQMWLDGNWNWQTFEALTKELDTAMSDRADHYVIGGRTYNWAYSMIHANGGYIVNDQLDVGVLSTPTLNALQYIANLYDEVRWRSESDLSNTVEQEFVNGKIVFHNGSYWHAFNDTKFGNRSFTDLGFVPFPTGDDTLPDLSNYNNMIQFGPASFVVSRGYEKSNIPAGYEDFFIHDELIFQIWSEMQYFGDLEENHFQFEMELYKYYATDSSVEAHVSVLGNLSNDLFYTFGSDAYGQVEGSMMILLESALKSNDVRATMEIISPILDQLIEERFR
ncbi:MAG: ABC transporter substrate-binding protein [Candidatus Izemoplasmataceae bacterium]|jgi:fructooligosaccharide transport system substrate-binding protein|uniref:ABC transporter substrate-binding protein n=1 Tax=Liberiplasma polymorphum TaxID=3374570 RepID=UPI00377183A4